MGLNLPLQSLQILFCQSCLSHILKYLCSQNNFSSMAWFSFDLLKKQDREIEIATEMRVGILKSLQRFAQLMDL